MKANTFRFAQLTTALALALGAGAAMAESQYGYTTGAGGVTAQARVNLRVSVPKLILVRVGSAGSVDELAWTAAFGGIPGGPATLTAANNQGATWDGTAPTVGSIASNPNPASLAVYAWTNASGGGSLSYAVTTPVTPGVAFGGTNAPALSDISVNAGTGLGHPTPLALVAASTGAVTFARNALQTGNWTYSLNGGSAANWAAGDYTATVTYTATSL